MFYMYRLRRFLVWLLAIYAVVYFVGFLCVRSNWGKGLVADHISSKTGCFVKLERASLGMNFKIHVFDLSVFADKDMKELLFAAPTLRYGWGTLEARRIKVVADFDVVDRPFSSSLHKFASEEDFYKVDRLNAFSLSLFEKLDDVDLYDISIELKVKGKIENHFLTKFIKKPLDLPDEDDFFYFVLGDNLRWITTSHGKIISSIVGPENKSAKEQKVEKVAEKVEEVTTEPAEESKAEPVAESVESVEKVATDSVAEAKDEPADAIADVKVESTVEPAPAATPAEEPKVDQTAETAVEATSESENK